VWLLFCRTIVPQTGQWLRSGTPQQLSRVLIITVTGSRQINQSIRKRLNSRATCRLNRDEEKHKNKKCLTEHRQRLCWRDLLRQQVPNTSCLAINALSNSRAVVTYQHDVMSHVRVQSMILEYQFHASVCLSRWDNTAHFFNDYSIPWHLHWPRISVQWNAATKADLGWHQDIWIRELAVTVHLIPFNHIWLFWSALCFSVASSVNKSHFVALAFTVRRLNSFLQYTNHFSLVTLEFT